MNAQIWKKLIHLFFSLSYLQMIKMMVTIVIVFTICWLPFNVLVVSTFLRLKYFILPEVVWKIYSIYVSLEHRKQNILSSFEQRIKQKKKSKKDLNFSR